MNARADDIAVLVPANASVIPLACIRSLGKRGVPTVVATDDRNVPACSSRYCTESRLVPSPNDDLTAYKASLLSLAERPDIRTIIPVREEDIYVLSKFRSEFEEHVSVIAPSYGALRSVHDRYRLVEIADELGVSVPETRLLDEVDEWDDDLIVKPRFSILTSDYVDSHLTSRIDNMRGETTFVEPGQKPDLDAIDRDMEGHTPIVQEAVPIEHEYMYSGLYDHGEEVASWQQRYLRRKTYGEGGSVYREAVFEPELADAGRKILDHLDWHGTACIEFMKDANTGEFKLTEINPRLWLSVPCAIRAGADFPYYHWLLAMGARERIDPGYELGVATHSLYGELSYLKSVLSEDYPSTERPSVPAACASVLASCIDRPQFDYVDRTDLKPFVKGLYNAVLYSETLGIAPDRSVEEPISAPN
ncbi:carboxylate--amine ligase [Natrinema versiforme]|uniref:ATP-grasp protein-like protein n=1 Tax=Natrinema versiforme JCM 10478 TaxID=1227496 RepID=L9XZS0_9EURY|nr:hypothetical protein [Natrinema versiforme]ELY67290.1 ATP-grasp protein-like protein [Natrinema versiforme JCM 10478]